MSMTAEVFNVSIHSRLAFSFDNYNVNVTVNNEQIELKLLDTAGEEDYHDLRRQVYPMAASILHWAKFWFQLICFQISECLHSVLCGQSAGVFREH